MNKLSSSTKSKVLRIGEIEKKSRQSRIDKANNIGSSKSDCFLKINFQHQIESDSQANFFIPNLSLSGFRDSRSFMDLAIFRLSKTQKRPGEILRYEIPFGYVEISSGPHGMASIWDYDIFIMMVSHLTEATNLYKKGKASKPSRIFTPAASDILNFCQKGDGSRQYHDLEAALSRLQGTVIKIVHEIPSDGVSTIREAESEGLIGYFRVISRTKTGYVKQIEIEAPNWLYQEITQGKQPKVLKIHPDYFLMTSAIGKFIYRFARFRAGSTIATWSFKNIYVQSGSTATFKRFISNLRKLISANNLPEYSLKEIKGKSGEPILEMTKRK